MTALRSYQSDLYQRARQALAGNRAVCVQSPTGSGKTPLVAAMCESVHDKNKTAWILVGRKELITQTSKHLSKWGVPHNRITPDSKESTAYKIHIVSSDTLIRRLDKVKRWPALLIIDECHLAIDRQKMISERLPVDAKIVGLSATPERADGRGLSVQAGGIYDELITGPSIPYLTERGYLAPLRYFAPPLEGLDKLKFRGIDADAEELEELLKRRKVYGQVVDHYAKYGRGRQALIFCRSIKSADETAQRFRDRGFQFWNIDSTMSDARRVELFSALNAGTIDGLTGVDIFSYGVDVPRVSYGASIRPTISRALYMQAVGRIIRPFSDPATGYVKKEAIFMDHVNLILDHQDDHYPGTPLHYIPEISWNFHGTVRRKRDKTIKNVVLCPHLDFLYCPGGRCATCSHNPDKTIKDARRPMVIVPAELVEAAKPVPLHERPSDERRDLEDRISRAVLEYKQEIAPGPVGELLRIADELGRSVMWVYWALTTEDRLTVNHPLLAEIARQKGFKAGWTYFAAKRIRDRKVENKKYEEAMG